MAVIVQETLKSDAVMERCTPWETGMLGAMPYQLIADSLTDPCRKAVEEQQSD